jgi:RimJ/RimL family protein N-acetyltransferase
MDINHLKRSGERLAIFNLEGASLFHVRCAYPDKIAVRSEDARFFATLRARNTLAFFDMSAPGEEEVLEWVKSVYDCDNSQINFIVSDEDGRRLGFFGITGIGIAGGEAEFGRVMKVRDAPRGLMQGAMTMLFAWARDALALRRLKLEVFSDNERAIALYQRVGFVATGSHRRLEQEKGGQLVWLPNATLGDRSVLEMELDLQNG